MYILLTGKHPFYRKGEPKEEFLRKMKSPNWVFTPAFSEYAVIQISKKPIPEIVLCLIHGSLQCNSGAAASVD